MDQKQKLRQKLEERIRKERGNNTKVFHMLNTFKDIVNRSKSH